MISFPFREEALFFSNLPRAQIFSKFDLKAGFWQLGIQPDERPKTAFCIPGHHYQWKVLPFGLKTAPSLFQKAMTQIFSPIQSQALIYIDDILLFSPNKEAHKQLLREFTSIIKSHGIMLSEKTMAVGLTEVDFLGMTIKDGAYVPQPTWQRSSSNSLIKT